MGNGATHSHPTCRYVACSLQGVRIELMSGSSTAQSCSQTVLALCCSLCLALWIRSLNQFLFWATALPRPQSYCKQMYYLLPNKFKVGVLATHSRQWARQCFLRSAQTCSVQCFFCFLFFFKRRDFKEKESKIQFH